MSRIGFFAGLFLVTLATLALEILDTRLLSVLVWYHLSFFAVSIAMLGMAAGAVAVYLGGAAFEGEAARRALARHATYLALSIPLCHLMNIAIPVMDAATTNGVLSLAITSVFLGVPFYCSGVVVTTALTRGPGPIGLVYAVDLLGAALGSLLLVPLLRLNNITSAVLMTGAIAGLGAICFAGSAGRSRKGLVALVLALASLAVWNSWGAQPVRLVFQKGEYHPANAMAKEYWTIHGQVVRYRPVHVGPPLWSGQAPPGQQAPLMDVIPLIVDGHAATGMTKWDGKVGNLYWTQWDVTSLPYHIRQGGDVAVIGVGGGRDVLTAIYARAKHIDGIEINRAFIEMLTKTHRDYAKLADYPGVSLIHDEARSYLTRTEHRYDVIQMSLIDTWAATGAGAFTLSENGLYTVEAWQVFLGRLKPHGLVSVSRFFSAQKASETSRLVSVATAALLRHGAKNPADHIALVARGNVATLVVSNDPLSAADLTGIRQASTLHGWVILLAPGGPSIPLLQRIASSRTEGAIYEVVANEPFDYTPATDERPYFFNLLKPSSALSPDQLRTEGGVLSGNLVATLTLLVLLIVVAALLLVVVFGPLLRHGLPQLRASSFGLGVLYFGLIGMGFMLIQIGLMQRLSVYLGHPTYAVVVVLFSMILASGVGSYLSDRLAIEKRLRWPLGIPAVTVGILALVTLLLQPVVTGTIQLSLVARCLVAVSLVAPLAAMLGMFFPMGMRLLGRLSASATAWMWGVNGAAGVLASVVAVAISMWSGIHTNFYVALVAYALIALPAWQLWRRGAEQAAGDEAQLPGETADASPEADDVPAVAGPPAEAPAD